MVPVQQKALLNAWTLVFLRILTYSRYVTKNWTQIGRQPALQAQSAATPIAGVQRTVGLLVIDQFPPAVSPPSSLFLRGL